MSRGSKQTTRFMKNQILNKGIGQQVAEGAPRYTGVERTVDADIGRDVSDVRICRIQHHGIDGDNRQSCAD
jgi:hypothetical protein